MKKVLWICLVLSTACQPAPEDQRLPGNPGELPAFTDSGVNAVIEIPAGTNRKIEYDEAANTFAPDERDGKERVIDFLPYPGNYGFIPGTHVDEQSGGDGDALDILVISEAIPTGSLVEAIPIALLRLRDEGQQDDKVIAIPADSSLQVIAPKDYLDFSLRYDGAKLIIENWFLYYDGLGAANFEGWGDEKAARRAIEARSTSAE
jgi:inorganic pyrophosphatase